jgi:hypothetical protein
MFVRITTASAALIVAALAVTAGAFAKPAVICRYAVPTSRAEAIACASRDVNVPLSPKVLGAIREANARVGQSVLSSGTDKGLDPALANALQEAQPSYGPHSTLQEGLDPKVAESLRDAQSLRASVKTSGDGFDWGSAGIGAAFGAVVLLTAVGSGAVARRRRTPLSV